MDEKRQSTDDSPDPRHHHSIDEILRLAVTVILRALLALIGQLG